MPPADRDDGSETAVKLLAGISEIVWGPHLYRGDSSILAQIGKRGLKMVSRLPGSIVISTGDRPEVELGVYAELVPGKHLEFCIDIRHDRECWLIDTVVMLDNWPEEEGMTTLRSFPTRRAATIDECVEQLRAAAVDLASCIDVLDEPPVLAYLHKRS